MGESVVRVFHASPFSPKPLSPARLVHLPQLAGPELGRDVTADFDTDAVNLVAQSWGRANLHAGDAVLLTEMEHHANIVPWMILSEELGGLDLRYVPVDGSGRLVLDELDRLLDGVKIVGVSCMSNVLGTINPVRLIADAAHEAGAVVVADGAQLVPHAPVDVARSGSTSSRSRPTR